MATPRKANSRYKPFGSMETCAFCGAVFEVKARRLLTCSTECARGNKKRGKAARMARYHPRWREQNRDRLAEYKRQRYEADPDRTRKQSAEWRCANPERYAALNHRNSLRRSISWKIVKELAKGDENLRKIIGELNDLA